MNTQLLLVVWLTIFAAYVIVAVMRWKLGMREDDHLHFADSEQQAVATQAMIAHKLDVLDRWKTALLALTVASAIVFGALHVYMSWQATSRTVSIR